MLTTTKIKLTYSIIFLIIGFLLGWFIAKSVTQVAPIQVSTGEKKQVNEVLKIGFVGPLTGDNANLGQPIADGIQLAVEDVNNAGGVNRKKLTAVLEDGKCNGKDGATAGTKLIEQDKVIAIVGGTCSSETLAIAPMANENKIPMISPSSTNPSITTAGDYIFRVVGSDALQGKVMAEYVFNKGMKKAAVIYANSDYNLGLKNVFSDTFTGLGGKVVAAETYEQDSKDFKTQLTKIKAANPDAIYIVPYSEGGLIAKQAKELGIEIPLFGPETFESPVSLQDGGNALEGLIFTKPKFDANNTLSSKILSKYKSKYGKDSDFPAYMTNAYDAVMLIKDALKKEESSESIKNYLYKVKDYDGAGGKLTIDSNGDALKDFEFEIIKNGKFKSLKE